MSILTALEQAEAAIRERDAEIERLHAEIRERDAEIERLRDLRMAMRMMLR